MQQADTSVTFADISLSSKSDALKKYFLENFKSEYQAQNDSEPDSIKVANPYLTFVFTKSTASVSIKAEAYQSFAISMQPSVGKLISFLNVVGISEVSDISLQKQNVWKMKSEDILSAYKNAIPYIFMDDHIREVAKFNIPEGPKPIKLSREANVDLGDGILKIGFSAEITDDHHFQLVLDLKATARHIKTTDMLESSAILNDVIYGAFHDLVTPDIIKLMEKQG